MNIRELRQILTQIDNQDLTVYKLRQILFEEENQDREINLEKRTFYINNERI